MSDIFCSKCGEPWDIYELHDMPQATTNPAKPKKLTFKEAAAAFSKYGCGAFDNSLGMRPMKLCNNEMVDQEAADRAHVYQTMSSGADDWLDL